MFIILIFCLILEASSSNICDSVCMCRYDNKLNQDFQGEIVDCSYSVNILEANYSLPSTIYSLDLSSNNLSRIDSSDILRSETMLELFLNKNTITSISSNSLLLPALERLDMSDNLLEYIEKEAFRNVKKVEYLNLANNKFTTFDKLMFHHLSNLNNIILDNNDLGSSLREANLFDRSGFGLTKKIKSLSISGINIHAVPENFFVDVYDLRELVISNNNISEIFEIPYTLEYLDISDNPIDEISSEDFSDLPALKVLKLNNLHLREVPEYAFAPLHSLTTLELERNKKLTVFSPLAFGREVLEDADDFVLERLSIKGSRLTKLDKRLLQPFGQLIQLDLQGNPWICDCDLVWLKELQIPEPYYDHLRCSKPKPLYNSRIFELDGKYFCPMSQRHIGGVIAVVAFCVLLATTAIWLFVFLPKYQFRSNFIRQMCTPSTAYSILPLATSIPEFEGRERTGRD